MKLANLTRAVGVGRVFQFYFHGDLLGSRNGVVGKNGIVLSGVPEKFTGNQVVLAAVPD